MTIPPPLHGLTAADVDRAIPPPAARTYCCEGAPSSPGFGYAGGGFGPYRRCGQCGAIFAKTPAIDGNEGDRR